MDGEILLTPLEMSATVLENFDTISPLAKLFVPILEVEQDTFDFGVINSNDKVNISFKIKNVGAKDLIIRKVEASCNCMNIEIPQRVVKQGITTTLNFEYSSMGKTGRQYKHIRMFCNDPKHSMEIYLILWLFGIIWIFILLPMNE